MKDKKKVLGLDLGPNSIGWAIIERQINKKGDFSAIGISDAGIRRIPMDATILNDFARGNKVSQTKERTGYRSMRRLRERCLLRRERLHRVLYILGFLPKHYAECLTRYGKFKDGLECKLPWTVDAEGNPTFIFKQSYNEMLQLFWQAHPDMMKEGLKVPYDWTIYYLRQKALTAAINPQELAWILLNFNQKRGYYQARGEDQEERTKTEEYYALKVVDVINTNEKKGKDTWYDIVLENGMVYHRAASEEPQWKGKTKEFIVTTQLNEDGTPKTDSKGKVKRSFRLAKSEDWGLLKIKTQNDIRQSGKRVGEYIFCALLANPKQKIKGKLVHTIERVFYREELDTIINTQMRFIPQLQDKTLYDDCIKELYQQNDSYRQSIEGHDFRYLFVDNILFYQRPLKSKKSLIDECEFESHSYINKDGIKREKYIKCISKSHPLFQEFRLWQFITNLRVYRLQNDENGRHLNDEDVTSEFLPNEEAYVSLFDFLNCRTEIKQEDLLVKYFKIRNLKGGAMTYRWNYVEDKKYPCNETRGEIISKLSKAGISIDFLDQDSELSLWHILYSVSNPKELYKALSKYAARYSLDSNFADVMVKFPPFKSDYGSYSAKAIKRLLPLMRMGKYWSKDNIDATTKERINKIIDGEMDETISDRVREKAYKMTSIEQFRGLPLWLACYVVYNRHSETSDTSRWEKPEDINKYLKDFKQHSLRNPIVEQVVTETLRVVRDIWTQEGHIDEIHIEMGRELKNSSEKRKKITERALQNEATNLRVKALLTEFLNISEIKNVRPYSPSQQEILRIYEDTALKSVDDLDDEIANIIGKFAKSDVKNRPTPSDIRRYALWLEQHYISPYTNETIPLSRLFTSDYEIEHIIPQSRYFDDSSSNKVICEAQVNKLKGNMLGYEFIQKHHGEIVELGGGRTATILEPDAYCRLVENFYRYNSLKMKKLLMEDIPTQFIERQLNDSRYISKFIKSLLSRIVREEGEKEAISKNIVVCTGVITDRLKRDWGINEVWNHIILPRFERMNELTGTTKFTTINTSGHLIPDMPLELQKGFNKKRIDHRHHAMDAIVIACATRDHVNLMSNEAASPKNNSNRIALSKKLRRYEEVPIQKDDVIRMIPVAREFIMPWPSFPTDVEKVLLGMITSTKQNLRVITKTSNYSMRYVDGKKRMVKQVSGDSWAIRKPMHKETVYGEVNLRDIKTGELTEAMANPYRIVSKELKKQIRILLSLNYSEKQIKQFFEDNHEAWKDVDLKKIKMYYFSKETNDRFFATRKSIDDSFKEDRINKITDSGIRAIMLQHLRQHGNNAKQAFSPDGIDEMNRNIRNLNKGANHQPIYKIREYEKAEKFSVGQKGNKQHKFVEAAKGTNLFFAITEKEEFDPKTETTRKIRSFRTIPLNEAIRKMKAGLPLDEEATFVLSPNDIVYLPTEEEQNSGVIKTPVDHTRLYRFVSAAGSQADFVPHNSANTIYAVKKEFAEAFCQGSTIQNEYGLGSPKSKNEKAITGEMIKAICVPVKIDRLGHILKIGV